MRTGTFTLSFNANLTALLGPSKTRILAAVSGGADSMVLLDLLSRWNKDTGGFVAIGHVNHNLRGPFSRKDEMFVHSQAENRSLPFQKASVDAARWAQTHKRGIEESCRFLRYRSLNKMARQHQCSFILTAHTMNDQVETVFLHLIRGTGPQGLAGMAAAGPLPWAEAEGPKLLRPFLIFQRAQIIRYLNRKHLSFRHDSTNDDPVFLRNKIRPVLKSWEKHRPGFFSRVSRLADLVRDEEEFWGQKLAARKKGLVRRHGGRRRLELRPFMRYHRVEQRRILRQLFGLISFAQIEGVRALAKNPLVSTKLLFRGGSVERRKSSLVFRPSPVKTTFSKGNFF